MIKYWCHLVKDIEDNNNLLKEAIQLSSAMNKNNHESWVGCIHKIFKYLKLEYIFINENKYKTNFIVNKVKENLTIIFKKQWLNKINSINGTRKKSSGNKLRTYKKFKNNFAFENYLHIGSKSNRQIITKFRVSAHDLEIERGRYSGVTAENRICRLCNLEVEDEFHFLLKCPSLARIRDIYMQKIYKNFKNIVQLSDENKFIWILSSEDKLVFDILANMLHTLFEERKLILKKIEETIPKEKKRKEKRNSKNKDKKKNKIN